MSNPYSFETGRLVMTSGIAEAMQRSVAFSVFVSSCIQRYVNADWGNTHPNDCKLNRQAIRYGNERIVAVYANPDNLNEIIWIITEADRSYTTILFPDEY